MQNRAGMLRSQLQISRRVAEKLVSPRVPCMECEMPSVSDFDPQMLEHILNKFMGRNQSFFVCSDQYSNDAKLARDGTTR